jgi:type II secretory ATPase GspE/PulE/Tfp pilus assembly ATPase PilB-like protein
MSAMNKLEMELQNQLQAMKLGDYLERNNLTSIEQIETALKSKKGGHQIKLGEVLLQEHLITESQLDEALRIQTTEDKLHLGEILVRMNVISCETINLVLAQKLGIPFVDLTNFQFDLNAIKDVPADLVQKNSVIPLYRTTSHMVVAMENPYASEALKSLAFYSKLKIRAVMASAQDIARMIDRFYGAADSSSNIADLVGELNADQKSSGQQEELNLPDSVITESDNTLVRLVNKIILDAHEQGVSDIHIETMRGNSPTRVRFRKDGILFFYSDIPANFRKALISRLKIMSHLDISERRRSQDGKLNFEEFGSKKIELRVVTMPTTGGLEDIVMRILAEPKATHVDDLGLSPFMLGEIKKLALKPHGLLFVCGPTGSGKTTTVHSLLNYVNTPERKIWTVEDPIEITQEGLRQVQVQAKIQWTFAAVLRSFLRADPDIILVGETRDHETAKTVIEASLTGHLVFSTMHTNSAAESVVRLLDLGLDPFNFSDALIGVVGQRLVRRLCTACRKPYHPSSKEIHMLAHEYCVETEFTPSDVLEQWQNQYADSKGNYTLYTTTGCDQCNQKGYRGRLGVYELLVASPAVKGKIHNRANASELARTGMAEGMRKLKQDGIEKILQGHTDWEQIKTV